MALPPLTEVREAAVFAPFWAQSATRGLADSLMDLAANPGLADRDPRRQRHGIYLAPCHNIQPITPVENIVRMYECAQVEGRI